MRRIIITSILVLALALPALASTFTWDTPVREERFTDVPVDYKIDSYLYGDPLGQYSAFPSIDQVAELRWFLGYPDGTFRPTKTITQEQMVSVFERLLPQGLTREGFARILMIASREIIQDDPILRQGRERAWAFRDALHENECNYAREATIAYERSIDITDMSREERNELNRLDDLFGECVCFFVDERIEELKELIGEDWEADIVQRDRAEFTSLYLQNYDSCFNAVIPSTTTTTTQVTTTTTTIPPPPEFTTSHYIPTNTCKWPLGNPQWVVRYRSYQIPVDSDCGAFSFEVRYIGDTSGTVVNVAEGTTRTKTLNWLPTWESVNIEVTFSNGTKDSRLITYLEVDQPSSATTTTTPDTTEWDNASITVNRRIGITYDWLEFSKSSCDTLRGCKSQFQQTLWYAEQNHDYVDGITDNIERLIYNSPDRSTFLEDLRSTWNELYRRTKNLKEQVERDALAYLPDGTEIVASGSVKNRDW